MSRGGKEVRPSIMFSVAVLSAAAVVVPVGGPAGAAPATARTVAVPPQPGSPRSGSKIALGPSNGVVSTLAGPVSTPKGTGPEHNATFTSFDLSDRIKLQVNAGSGNLLIRSTDVVLPGIQDNLVLGAAYNSLLVGSDLQIGAYGRGWRSRAGADVKLIEADDKSVTYVAADGIVGRFTANGTGYDTPKQFKGTLTKDGSGWKFTENEGGRELYFTSAGLLDRAEDRNNNLTDYTYNAAGELTKVVTDRGATGAKTATVSYTNGRLTRIVQAVDASNSRQIQYSYDSRGNLAQILPSSGHAVKFGYDTSQRVNKITTGLSSEPGTETRVEYDSQHRVSAVTRVIANESVDNPDGRLAISRWAYLSSTETQLADANTDATKRVSDVSHTTYTVDDDKRITKTVDPDGHERSKTYTPYHDVASSTDALGKTNTSTYGANGGQSMTASSSPTGSGASASYANAATPTNPTGNFQPSSSTDSQKNNTTFAYNGAGNRTSAKNAEAAQADVDYNDDGTVKTATDPGNSGNPSKYAYDGSKQLSSITPPTGNNLGKREFTYDAFGRQRTATDGAGRTLTYEYDQDDRTTSISYSDGTTPVQFQFDGSGNPITRTDDRGTENFIFDRLNRLIQRGQEYYPSQYTYDPAGNLTKLHGDWRGDTVYSYDDRNLLTKMVVDGDATYTFVYDDDGRRTDTKLTVPGAGPATSASTHNTFDDSGRLTRTASKRWQRVNNADQESVVYDVSYCYAKRVGTSACSTAKADDTGLRQWQTENHRSGAVQVYTYDKSNRLTKATNLASGTYDYTYDSNGNRTSVKVNSTETQRLTFNSANQITTSGYTYDGAGNQPNGGSLTSNAVYNAAGQTRSTDVAAGSTLDLNYLGSDQSQLDSAINGDDQTYYTWGRNDEHGQPMLDEYQVANYDAHFIERDGSGTVVGVRVYEKKSDSWINYFPVLDGLGSVVALVRADGNLAGTFTFDPYGRTTNVTANEPVVTYLALGYAGGLRYGNLIKFGQRWYDSTTGRFTQQDNLNTIGDPGSGNRYAYAGDNPVNNTDPTGMISDGESIDAMGLLIGGVAGILTAGIVSEFAGPVVGGIVGGCVGGVVGSAVSQHGDVSVGGGVLNCAVGAVIGLAGGTFVKGGFRGGS
jgi:RHS repeat-associated protein